MNISKQAVTLLLSLIFINVMLYFTFEESNIFWYLYSFTLLVGISITIIYGEIKDELPTWQYLMYGIGYGTILYGIVRIGYFILTKINDQTVYSVSKFLKSYSPNDIWHYLILIFIVVLGEEIFWRGFIQQQFKKWVSPLASVLITSVLFSISIALSGFILGSLAALLTGLILGLVYEWKKSMPLIIVAHEVFVLLLLLFKPLL